MKYEQAKQLIFRKLRKGKYKSELQNEFSMFFTKSEVNRIISELLKEGKIERAKIYTAKHRFGDPFYTRSKGFVNEVV